MFNIIFRGCKQTYPKYNSSSPPLLKNYWSCQFLLSSGIRTEAANRGVLENNKIYFILFLYSPSAFRFASNGYYFKEYLILP